MKQPLGIDELVALGAFGIGLIFNQHTIFSGVAAVAIIYLLICVFFRKYEAVQQRLGKHK